MAKATVNLQGTSSFITGASYDPETQELDVNMSGRTFTFRDVPRSVVDAFAAADSPGKFYHSTLKAYGE